MEKLNFRIISKAGFLLALFGFFMPFVFNQNGFQVAGYLSQFFGNNAVTNSLYALFSFSCIGGILFLLLIMKKDFSIILDWIVISAAVIAMIVIFSEISEVLGSVSDFGSSFGISGAGRRVGNALTEYIQPGAYAVIIGLVIALFAQVISVIDNIWKSAPTTEYYKYPTSIASRISSLSSTENYSVIPPPGQAGEKYNVIANTAIRSGPENDQYIKKILDVGDKVSFINILKEKPNWFYVNILNSKDGGWCFAGHLKKA